LNNSNTVNSNPTILNPVNYNSGRDIRAFLDSKGLGIRKKFGQNFLINPRVRSALLDAMELRVGDEVWEIGPGLGAMTGGLLERGASVTAFEIDPAFAGILKELFAPLLTGEAPGRFRLIEGDALKTWRKAGAGPSEETLLFGNLPYNAAAALLADFIENGRFFKRMVVTVQREVALRMAASPGSPDYSSFSVLCSSVYKVSPLFVIKGASFYPAPRVDSQGVRLDPLPFRGELPRLFYPLVRGLFSSRRKIIRNTLTAFAASVIIDNTVSPEQVPPERAFSTAREAAAEALNRANISGDRRPETLDKDEFAVLAAFLEEIVK
jgi:16S rRNA (adenine1518-N6/adenine1519-N6)-dimethyltransferase